MKGSGIGVFEIALRAVCVLQLDQDIWVLHAFQKAKSGIKPPRQEIDLIHDRLDQGTRIKVGFSRSREAGGQSRCIRERERHETGLRRRERLAACRGPEPASCGQPSRRGLAAMLHRRRRNPDPQTGGSIAPDGRVIIFRRDGERSRR